MTQSGGKVLPFRPPSRPPRKLRLAPAVASTIKAPFASLHERWHQTLFDPQLGDVTLVIAKKRREQADYLEEVVRQSSFFVDGHGLQVETLIELDNSNRGRWNWLIRLRVNKTLAIKSGSAIIWQIGPHQHQQSIHAK